MNKVACKNLPLVDSQRYGTAFVVGSKIAKPIAKQSMACLLCGIWYPMVVMICLVDENTKQEIE